MAIRSKYIYLIFTWLIVGMAMAQVSFETKVSKRKLGVNERLKIDFVMNKNGDNFVPPDFKNFRIVQGPSQSISRYWINGVRSFSKAITYSLSPKMIGEFTIGQATVEIDGQTYKTSPIKIQVTSAVAKPNDGNNVDYLVDENVFLVAEISNTKPYLNEGITVLYKLYFRNPITVSDVRELESPSFSDFWSHLIRIQQVRVERGTYKGESFNEVVWKKVVLYPQKTGELVIEPLTLDLYVGVPSNRRDLFGGWIYRRIQKTISTGRRTIDVKLLPEAGKPTGFAGAVGDFGFDVILNKDALKASEAFQVKVKVSGKGNLKLFKLPKLNLPNTLEVYEPEHDEDVKTTLRGMQGDIEDNYTVVPKYRGKYPIPPISFSFFNPKTEKYTTLRSQEYNVDVFEGPIIENSPSEDKNYASRQVVKANENAFRFIKLDTQLSPIKREQFWLGPQFFILLLSPLVLVVILVLLRKYRFRKAQDSVTLKQQLAKKLVRKYLSSAKKALGKEQLFYEALERTLHNYLKAKLYIETTEFSKQKIQVLLQENGISEDSADTFVEVLKNCEIARYAKSSNVSMKADFERAVTIIATIDKQL